MDVKASTINAHCPEDAHYLRGEKCHAHKVASKRPLGYLIAWLQASRQSTCACKKDHYDLRPVLMAASAYEQRKQAHDLGRQQPQLRDFYEMDGDEFEPLQLK